MTMSAAGPTNRILTSQQDRKTIFVASPGSLGDCFHSGETLVDGWLLWNS